MDDYIFTRGIPVNLHLPLLLGGDTPGSQVQATPDSRWHHGIRC